MRTLPARLPGTLLWLAGPACAGGLLLLLGCNPNTTRPPFSPLAEAIEAELELPMDYAIRVIADALRADSIPVSLVQDRDGYLESPWFQARDGTPTDARPLGVEVVRVRAWGTPGRPGHTDIQLEAVYRPLADPSRPPRDLDRLVPPDHPVALRLQAAVTRLVTQFGDPSQLPQAPPAARRDSTARPDTAARPDTMSRAPASRSSR